MTAHKELKIVDRCYGNKLNNKPRRKLTVDYVSFLSPSPGDGYRMMHNHPWVSDDK